MSGSSWKPPQPFSGIRPMTETETLLRFKSLADTPRLPILKSLAADAMYVAPLA